MKKLQFVVILLWFFSHKIKRSCKKKYVVDIFFKTFLGTHLVGFYAQNAEVVAINAPHKAVKAMLGYAGNVLLDHLFRVRDRFALPMPVHENLNV